MRRLHRSLPLDMFENIRPDRRLADVLIHELVETVDIALKVT
jgi:hypothetical protein